MLLKGKSFLVMGLTHKTSLAYVIGEAIKKFGGSIVYTAESEKRLELFIKSLETSLFSDKILFCDITDEESVKRIFREIEPPLDGIVYSIAGAASACVRADSIGEASTQEIMRTLDISTLGFNRVMKTGQLYLKQGASVVVPTFISNQIVENYLWMGPCKAALESLVRQYAFELGSRKIRVNCLSAGPIRTLASRGIKNFDLIEEEWNRRAPLGWDINDSTAVGSTAVALLSDLMAATTGATISADGGFSGVAASSGFGR